MSTYEYHCEKCGHDFEAFQSISAKPLEHCPKELCAQKKWGKGRVKKKISAGAGLLFKGSGFYITDYRSQKGILISRGGNQAGQNRIEACFSQAHPGRQVREGIISSFPTPPGCAGL